MGDSEAPEELFRNAPPFARCRPMINLSREYQFREYGLLALPREQY